MLKKKKEDNKLEKIRIQEKKKRSFREKLSKNIKKLTKVIKEEVQKEKSLKNKEEEYK